MALWKIPAELVKTGRPHQVPLTDPLKDVLERLRSCNGDQEYVFFSTRRRTFLHVHRDSLNSHLKNMGHKGLTTAHGFRHLASTAGQEVLKVHSITKSSKGKWHIPLETRSVVPMIRVR